MGNVQSRKSTRQSSVNNTSKDEQSQSPQASTVDLEEYVMVTSPNKPRNKQTVLEFNPAKSHAVCVGIDKQKNDNFIGNNLGDVAAKNATSLGESLVTNVGLKKECVHVYTSRKDPDLCDKGAIKTHIITCAREVEEDGMFVFYFSGHVVVYKGLGASKDEPVHVLVPADFIAGDVKASVKAGITSDDFVTWIQKANCKARHILIILDCCYAGGIGKKIASTVDVEPQIHVMCACAAEEVTIPMNVLGNSVFCYFLLYVLKEYQPKGKFELDKNMDEIVELCLLFSSLLMCYSPEHGGLLRSALLQPEVHSNGHDEIDIPDGCDGGNGSHRLNELFSLYDGQADKLSLNLVARQWLRSRTVQESLKTLLSIDPLPSSLYNGILSALFYSVSCMHLVHDPTHVTERNLFITAAISIVSAIGFTCNDVSISREQLMMGLKFYYMPIKSVGFPATSIDKLFVDIHITEGTGSNVDQNTVSNTILIYDM